MVIPAVKRKIWGIPTISYLNTVKPNEPDCTSDILHETTREQG
jgi:hypothetical protein